MAPEFGDARRLLTRGLTRLVSKFTTLPPDLTLPLLPPHTLPDPPSGIIGPNPAEAARGP